MSRIAIVGAGVVGQATGKGLAQSGHSVIFLDIDNQVLKRLRNESYEIATLDQLPKIKYKIVMLCLPTRFHNGLADMSSIEEVLPYLGESISQNNDYSLVVNRSTVPPNTAERLIIPQLVQVSHKEAGKDFGFCMNPEFLREKSSLVDFLHPWSIVIGAIDKKSGDILLEVYKDIINSSTAIMTTDIRTAEMIKYAQNLYNATKISFTNEIWKVCQKLGLSCETVMESVVYSAEGMWNPEYGTKGGYAYSGRCLPKDTESFLSYARKELGLEMPMLESTIKVNSSMKQKQRPANNS